MSSSIQVSSDPSGRSTTSPAVTPSSLVASTTASRRPASSSSRASLRRRSVTSSSHRDVNGSPSARRRGSAARPYSTPSRTPRPRASSQSLPRPTSSSSSRQSRYHIRSTRFQSSRHTASVASERPSATSSSSFRSTPPGLNFRSPRPVEPLFSSTSPSRREPQSSPKLPTLPRASSRDLRRSSSATPMTARSSTSHRPAYTATISRYGEAEEERYREQTSDALNEVIMAVDMNRDGKVGCAYYIVLDETLIIEEDVSMGGIETVATLVLQAQPTSIMVPNRAPQTLTEFLEQDAQKLDDDDATEIRGLYILRHLVSAEFDYDASKKALLGLYNDASSGDEMPPGEEDEDAVHCIGGSSHRRLVRLEKTVNLSSHLSIGCAGAVLSDLERRRSTEYLAPGAEAPISFRVKAITMSSQSDVMLISADALLSLQIMRTELHPNPQRQYLGGSENKVKESLSIAGLLQALAGTVQGKARLRQMLFQPSLDVDVIEERQRTIAVFLRPENSDIAASIRRQLKKVKNIKAALHHVRGGIDRIRGQLSLRINDWRAILRFTMIATQLREDIRSLAGGQGLSIYAKLQEDIDTQGLLQAGEMIVNTIDFKLSQDTGQTEILPGASERLDELKDDYTQVFQELSDIRREVLAQVPRWAVQYVEECTIVPRLGFLIAVTLNPETGEGAFNGRGVADDEWHQVVTDHQRAYYKNKTMVELDDIYGDLTEEIADEEIEVIVELAAAVYKHENALIRASELVGELDSLFALALAAEKYNWARPKMTSENIIDIEGGRHPLQELLVPSFIPNDCLLKGGRGSEENDKVDLIGAKDEPKESSVLILTGPNSSGKSIYMKQVALIVYLAHIGSYVPVTRATIGITDRILTRVATRETAMDDESAFMTDLKQAAFSTNFATRRSLILADEFGKGTTMEAGAAIFAAYIYHFLELDADRPRMLVSTHFHDVFNKGFLKPEEGVAYAHMEVRLDPEAKEVEERITYLYRLVPGRAEHSLGLMCAAINGIQDDVLKRAQEILDMLEGDEDIEEVFSKPSDEDIKALKDAELVARRFLAMELPEDGSTTVNGRSVRDMVRDILTIEEDGGEVGEGESEE
ncbi:muts domain V-domain-containing protein [Pseudoneurospora amorphoporcata]|uniref:DNA mismatch repair protein MSH5 n=1 Tax=Pseudoneurospora amorphoporcata TaxID=241081 RepID=A0AAN6P409_9PEZI|nr:muts domain V-domain-containing protein [Pseudoneurospora amorphoporcata]